MSNSILLDHFNRYGRTCGSTCIGLFPPVICADGAFMSIQASADHHCSPRETFEANKYSEYTHVEVYTDLDDEDLNIYKDEDYPMDHGYVAIGIIDEVITKHGGIDTKAVEEYIEKIKERN